MNAKGSGALRFCAGYCGIAPKGLDRRPPFRPSRLGPMGIDRQRGISAVEILIALVIGLILVAGVAEVYLGAKQSYRLQDAQGRIQENGRYALEILQNDLRQAGYMGCPSLAEMTFNTPPPNPQLHLLAKSPAPSFSSALPARSLQALQGYDDVAKNWTPTFASDSFLKGWSSAGTQSVIAGTDVIAIQFAESCGGRVQAGATDAGATIAAGNACSLTASVCGGGSCASGDLLVISDCKSADVFRAKTVTAGGATIGVDDTVNGKGGKLSKAYGVDAEVLIFRPRIYFIRLNPNGDPSLYRLDNANTGATADEVIEGVENMQILYGSDSDGNRSAERYVTASEVTDWSRIIAVQIELTLRSTGIDAGNNLTASVSSSPFDGDTLVDRRLRRSFGVTVKLRNPLYQ